MKRFIVFAGKRLLFTVPQLLAVSVIVFFLIRLLPGDPTYMLAGPYATVERIGEVRSNLGLDQPLLTQYADYLKRTLTGDFGASWRTSQPVLLDIQQRLPATLELVVGGRPGFGADRRAARRRGRHEPGRHRRSAGLRLRHACRLAARFLDRSPADPGLLLRLGNGHRRRSASSISACPTPDHITGAYIVDAALTGNWEVFWSAAGSIVLPVATLVIVYMPLVLKTARSIDGGDAGRAFRLAGRASGLSRWTQLRYALRNALPPVVTVIGILFWFLLGGAVLVETIFAWGGLGQYAVESVINSDYAPHPGGRAGDGGLHDARLPDRRPRLFPARPADLGLTPCAGFLDSELLALRADPAEHDVRVRHHRDQSGSGADRPADRAFPHPGAGRRQPASPPNATIGSAPTSRAWTSSRGCSRRRASTSPSRSSRPPSPSRCGVALGVLSGFFAGAHRRSAGSSAARSCAPPTSSRHSRSSSSRWRWSASAGRATRNVIMALAFLNIPFFLRAHPRRGAAGALADLRRGRDLRRQHASCASPSCTSCRTRSPRRWSTSRRRSAFRSCSTAGLSFVGAGVPPPTPELGLDDPGRRPEHDDRAVVDRALPRPGARP